MGSGARAGLLILAACLAWGAASSAEPPAGSGATSGQEMIRIAAGEFTMGSSSGDTDEAPPHRVRVGEFLLGRREVTHAEYGRFLTATKRPRPPHWSDPRYGIPKHPIISVTWEEASAYAQWAGGRLPTEAEWEFAARGPEGRAYPWGSASPTKELAAFHLDIGFDGTLPAGSKPAGATPSGLLDMVGNAYEWCSDWYAPGYYSQSPQDNPGGPATGELRVVRGGSWISLPDACRATARAAYRPEARSVLVGFRIARDAPAASPPAG